MPLSNTSTLAADLRSKFLEGFSPLDLKVILAAARLRHFTSNSVIVNQGNPADCLFLLTKGRARFFFNTQEGKKIILHWLTPGEIFGGAALLSTPSRYLVSAETLKDSSMFVWDRATRRRVDLLGSRHWRKSRGRIRVRGYKRRAGRCGQCHSVHGKPLVERVAK